jgi:hypothetical protein
MAGEAFTIIGRIKSCSGRARPAFAELFISFLLARISRVEEDLVDQLFNSSEKRLARILLLLANFGKEGRPEPIIAKISQETLAEMTGTTRSRVSFFMNKFRDLGYRLQRRHRSPHFPVERGSPRSTADQTLKRLMNLRAASATTLAISDSLSRTELRAQSQENATLGAVPTSEHECDGKSVVGLYKMELP